jgi:hypothetical protein
MMKLGLLDLLTIAFVVMKLTGHVDWSWPVVFIPEMVSVFIDFISGVSAGLTLDSWPLTKPPVIKRKYRSHH